MTDPERPQPAGNASAPELPGEVLEALRERQPEALERFYDAYFDRVYSYVRRLLRDEHLAEDLAQDIFMHIHRSLPSYDPTRDLRPWVFTIATNKVRDFWQSRRYRESRTQVSHDDTDGASLETEADERGPREMLESAEVGGQVSEAIRRLPDGLRTTFMLRFYEELSFAEIGAIIERTEVAVRKRYSRALQELREALEGVLSPEGGPR